MCDSWQYVCSVQSVCSVTLCLRVSVYVYVCMYICMYVYMYVYLCGGSFCWCFPLSGLRPQHDVIPTNSQADNDTHSQVYKQTAMCARIHPSRSAGGRQAARTDGQGAYPDHVNPPVMQAAWCTWECLFSIISGIGSICEFFIVRCSLDVLLTPKDICHMIFCTIFRLLFYIYSFSFDAFLIFIQCSCLLRFVWLRFVAWPDRSVNYWLGCVH